MVILYIFRSPGRLINLFSLFCSTLSVDSVDYLLFLLVTPSLSLLPS